MSYSYISREQLSKMIVDRHPSLAIIDVRDDDHIGGHIHTSTNVPSTTLDYKIPELVRTLKDKQTVVFHCALSQQRGPTAARRYIEAREKMLEKTKAPVKKVGSGHAVAGSSTDAANTTPAETKEPQEPPKQQIYVLDGGFEKWQEK
ncbi:MAG: hypothetical protein MMC33_008852 [Icmadophila ericetorum]|nr:hypothetical protein [Icmadophila ericetorum]